MLVFSLQLTLAVVRHPCTTLCEILATTLYIYWKNLRVLSQFMQSLTNCIIILRTNPMQYKEREILRCRFYFKQSIFLHVTQLVSFSSPSYMTQSGIQVLYPLLFPEVVISILLRFQISIRGLFIIRSTQFKFVVRDLQEKTNRTLQKVFRCLRISMHFQETLYLIIPLK